MLKMQIWILFFYSVAVMDGLSLSAIKKFCIGPPKDYPLQDNLDSGRSLLMFNENGLGTDSDKRVYMTKDGRTGVSYGHGICKQVVQRVKTGFSLKNVMISYKGRLESSVYQHGNDQFDENFLRLFGAKCYYGDGENDYLFVCNGPNKFYYIFTPKEQTKLEELKIIACLKIIPKKTDYPEIKIEETSDFKTADRIFGKFGTLSKIEKRHVCNKISPEGSSSDINGQAACQNVLIKQNIKYTDMNVSCEVRQITRQILKQLKPRVEYKVTYPQDIVKCSYKDDTGNQKSFWVLNTSHKEFFYIIEEDPKLSLIFKSCIKLPN